MTTSPTIIALNIGNTRIQAGLFIDGALSESEHFFCDDLARAVERVVRWWDQIASNPSATVVAASVNDPVADRFVPMIEDQLSRAVYRIGPDIPPPVGIQLDPETITGVDRLLNAASAYDTLKEACIVIDAGTAITVDFVDGAGTFHGGAIAPGGRMQLLALHGHTAALPDLEFELPQPDAFGRSTSQAMLQGVYQGIRGMVWRLVEQYAEEFGAYPSVIATGGDAELLFKDEELVDRIAPDLTLRGIMIAARSALGVEESK